MGTDFPAPGRGSSPRGQPWSDSSACPFASPLVRSEPHEWLGQKKDGLHRRLEFGFLELMAVKLCLVAREE